MVDIEAWLRELGLERYADAFRANEIDHLILPILTVDDLSDIGVKIVGHRREILNAAEALQHQPTSATTKAILHEQHNAETPSPSKVPDAERRHLTLMFVDLVGSTALSSRLDPEEMSQLIRDYQNAVAGEVMRFRGHVAKFLGDGVLVYFGFPAAHEDDAERSVRAAMSIIEALERVDTREGLELQARIGIATGLVVVGDLIGQGVAEEAAVVGETPDLAARLQGVAESGQILVSAATRHLLGEQFLFDDFGVRRLKGLDQPVQVHLLRGKRVVEGCFVASQSGRLGKMAGRDQELALLIARWRQAKAGEGQCVLLIGEAGIGKSRIIQALIDEIAVDQPIKLFYQCSPHHRDSAFYPAIRQLARAADLRSEDSSTRKLDKLEKLLRQAVNDIDESAPLIAALLGIHDESRYGKIDLSPQKQRVRTLQVLIDQLIGLAHRSPSLLIVEDAHWIDPSTLQLIEQTIDAIAASPVLVLVTTRPVDQVDLRGHANVTSLSLNRLPKQHAMAVVQRLLGGMSLPQDVLDDIVAKTDGVPLFVEEVAKAVVEEGLLSAKIPASLHDSLMARLDRIPDARQVAQIAAVIGREFDFKLLCRVSTAKEDELSSALARLTEAELVFCRGAPPDASYSFKHALVRDAAYESLLHTKRRALHAQIADALIHTDGSMGRTDEVLAYHLASAERYEAAIRTRTVAAERASGQAAYLEALALVDAAADLLAKIEVKDRQLELEFSLELLRAEIRQVLEGPSKAAYASYERVLDLARQAGDQRGEFLGVWGLYFLDEQSFNLPSASKRANELAILADASGDPDQQLQANHANWGAAFYRGDLPGFRKHALAGLEHYDSGRHYPAMLRFGGHDAGCCARFHLAQADCLQGYPDTAVKKSAEAIESARELGHLWTLSITLHAEAIMRQLIDDVDGVERANAEFGDVADHHGLARFIAIAPIMNGWIRVCRGDDRSAIKRMQEGMEALRSTGGLLRLSYYWGLIADAQRRAGDVDAALDSCDHGIRFAETRGESWYLPELHRLKGTILIDGSDADEGVRHLKLALDLAGKMSTRWFELRTAASLAAHLVNHNERQEAKDLLQPIYSWFTEGANTPNLKSAKALLQMP